MKRLSLGGGGRGASHGRNSIPSELGVDEGLRAIDLIEEVPATMETVARPGQEMGKGVATSGSIEG